MTSFTRISYNSANWRRPTGDARNSEAPGTYNHINGFGHEDWLFRSEWQIAGWRYAFLQGVNKSHARLIKEAQTIDLTLFTVEPDRRRRYVATIREVECLTDAQAKIAVDEFKARGWFQKMMEEINAVDGNTGALGNAEWAKHVLNVRFKLSNVAMFRIDAYAEAGDPLMQWNRYMLYGSANPETDETYRATRKGSTEAPLARAIQRRFIPATEYSPEHARMQAVLLSELKFENPEADITCETDYVDVSLRSDREVVLFEIKSDLAPRAVLRQALGQLLEYAFYPKHQTAALPIRLVAVGRLPLSAVDQEYLDKLRHEFNLPLEYRVVAT